MRGGPLVVVGDTVLDVDIEGAVDRIAPDAPVPVVDCQRERHRPGGAGLAAVLAAAAGRRVVLITALGADGPGGRLRELLSPFVEVLALPLRGATPCKIRIRAAGQSLARLDVGRGEAAAGPVGSEAAAVLRDASAILVADYGRKLTAQPRLRALLADVAARTPVIWDPHPRGERPVAGARLVTPNQAEARAFAAGAFGQGAPSAGSPGAGGIGPAAKDALTLHREWGTPVAVTLGPGGALLCVGDDTPFLAPAPPPSHHPSARADTCGAGDCFAATVAQVMASGGLLTEAVVEAVARASGYVAAGGVRTVPSRCYPAAAGETGDGYQLPAATAGDQPAAEPAAAASWPGVRGALVPAGRDGWDVASRVRRRGGRIVATGGCFDLLHAGHVGLLRQARRLGDCLIVCLNSDSSVRALKGPGRPLVSAPDRARVLAALDCVDGVIIFDQTTPSDLLERLRPDVWVKGGDYAPGQLAEAAAVRRHGGEVILLPYAARHSTSRIVAAARQAAAPSAGGGDD